MCAEEVGASHELRVTDVSLLQEVTELVSPVFAIFFFAYITLVSFGLIRVITAAARRRWLGPRPRMEGSVGGAEVFLKDTMEAAQCLGARRIRARKAVACRNDSELALQKQMKMKA